MSIFKYLRILIVFLVLGVVSVLFITETQSKSIAAPNAPAEVKTLLNNVSIGSGKTFKNMTVYPLIAKTMPDQKFLLLDDSMNDGTLEVKEKGSGSVNNLEVQKNSSKYPVFIMSGEIVKGAKQDRIISNDLIFDKGEKLYTIAVYCVEQGRWVKKSDKFAPAAMAGSNKLRSTVAQKKSQSAVWDKVASKNRSFGASSGTSNYRASYEVPKYKEEASEYFKEFSSFAKDNPKMVGVIVKIDNNVSNLDVFINHETFSALWPKLLKAYAQDAIDPEFTKSIPKISTAQSLLNTLNNSDYSEIANPGIGNEYTIKSGNAAGSMLTYNDKIAHLALFADSSEYDKEPTPIYNNRNNNMQLQQQYQQTPNMIRHRPTR